MQPQSFNARPKSGDWDGDWRCVSYSPAQDVSTWHKYYHDDEGYKLTVQQRGHGVEEILNSNAVRRASNSGKRWGSGQVVATIPPLLYQSLGLADAVAEGDQKYIAKVLNDADNEKLRTFEGRV